MTSPKINNETYINRELSWIDFNKRVLELAIEEDTPLLEKIKFSSIFSNNLFRVKNTKNHWKINIFDSQPGGGRWRLPIIWRAIFSCALR